MGEMVITFLFMTSPTLCAEICCISFGSSLQVEKTEGIALLTSRSVIIPTTLLYSSITGRCLTPVSSIFLLASSIPASGPIVMTLRVIDLPINILPPFSLCCRAEFRHDFLPVQTGGPLRIPLREQRSPVHPNICRPYRQYSP